MIDFLEDWGETIGFSIFFLAVVIFVWIFAHVDHQNFCGDVYAYFEQPTTFAERCPSEYATFSYTIETIKEYRANEE